MKWKRRGVKTAPKQQGESSGDVCEVDLAPLLRADLRGPNDRLRFRRPRPADLTSVAPETLRGLGERFPFLTAARAAQVVLVAACHIDPIPLAGRGEALDGWASFAASFPDVFGEITRRFEAAFPEAVAARGYQPAIHTAVLDGGRSGEAAPDGGYA